MEVLHSYMFKLLACMLNLVHGLQLFQYL